EQRNGRIDRTLQPSTEVRCHYFVYEQREEDVVLEKLVTKVGVIQDELGSLGDVVMRRIEKSLSLGINGASAGALDATAPSAEAQSAVNAELERQRTDLVRLQQDTDESGRILNESEKQLGFDPDLLRDTVDVGLA